MAINKGIRTGGRSARVQQSVHAAVKNLLETHDRADVTVPMIAQQAGVTPSTIYRRWGDISTLLADVALNRFDLDDTLPDIGDFRRDVLSYAEQYFDEMNSTLGRSMLRDMIAADNSSATLRCGDMLATRLAVMSERAVARGETVPEIDFLIDGIFAPMVYRILFSSIAPNNEYVRGLVDQCVPPE